MTTANIDLGKIRFKWQGTWNSATAYTRDDCVQYAGQAFVCVVDTESTSTNVTPLVGSTDWELMAAGGDPAATMTTPGDLLVRGAGGLERLAAPAGHQALVSDSGQPVWQPAWRMISSQSIKYTGGSSAAGTSRNWIPGMYADFTPSSATSKIFINAQFQHSDSGTGSITIAHVYQGTTRHASFNLSGHQYYVGNWNHINWWMDSWGQSSQRVGIQGSKYSSSYNIYWHLSSWTAADESPAQTNQGLAREALFTIQEWEPAS